MGRSSSSCLRIIACAGAPAADEGAAAGGDSPEIKAPSDKRRWSFRKKSVKDRDLSNSGISEPVSVVYNKESPGASVDNTHLPNILSVPEKDPIRPLSLPSENLIIVDPLVADTNATTTEHQIKDSDAVIIQAAIRGHCARTELVERKTVVELQLDARKLVAKRRIIGVFCCVQAVIKMQALVRVRETCQFAIESATNDDENFQIDMERSGPLGNAIAIINQVPQENEQLAELAAYESPREVLLVDSTSSDLKRAPNESVPQIDDVGICKTSAASGYQSSVLVSDDCIVSLPETDQNQAHLEDEALEMSPERSESAGNNSVHSTTRASCEPLENEGNRFVLGSRKTSNPAFAAVQSKFEELSSPGSLGRAIDSAYPHDLAKSNSNTRPELNSVTKAKRSNSVENSLPHDPRIQIAASECGTEISISSTLDSPDRSEVEGEEIVLEIGSLIKGNCADPVGADNSSNLVNMNIEAKNSSPEFKTPEPQRSVDDDGNLTDLILTTDAPQRKQLDEPSTPVMQDQKENSVDPQLHKSSPGGTPNSHVTVSESHGTPSSQLSVDAKKRKKDAKMLIRKQRPELVGKKSPSIPNNDSGGSTGNLPKDSKNGKRRNSFGMAKPDHVDHETKTSGSSTIPSYMQATESARAKAHASISPKLSPDVHENDNYLKKRHSFPISNVKQGSSPRMQKSPSQAQQVPNVNGNLSPNSSAAESCSATGAFDIHLSSTYPASSPQTGSCQNLDM